VRGYTVRGDTVRGDTVRGDTVRGYTVRGYTVRGYPPPCALQNSVVPLAAVSQPSMMHCRAPPCVEQNSAPPRAAVKHPCIWHLRPPPVRSRRDPPTQPRGSNSAPQPPPRGAARSACVPTRPQGRLEDDHQLPYGKLPLTHNHSGLLQRDVRGASRALLPLLQPPCAPFGQNPVPLQKCRALWELTVRLAEGRATPCRRLTAD
jgi:hypothetical protein